MDDMIIEYDANGRIIGLQHPSDPLRGTAHGMSAIATARAYLDAVAPYYELDRSLLDRIEERVRGEFTSGEGIRLRLRRAASVRDFIIITLQQTHDGLPVWSHGITVRMRGADNIITGSASSYLGEIDIPEIDAPPKDRHKKAAALLKRIAKTAGFDEFEVNRSRDFIYRYDADDRVPPLEPEEARGAGGHFEHLVPELPVGDASEYIKDGSYRHVSEIHFTATSKKHGSINWRALVDWEATAVLYLRALVSEATGAVFVNDPISLSGDPQLDPNAPVPPLDAQREMVALERLVLPGGGANTELTGELVTLEDVVAPNIPPPTEPGGDAAVFDYSADSDNFAAVCGYYTHDRLYRLMQVMGFDLPTYFDGATFPVIVDHRWSNTVNARAEGNVMGNGIGRYIYSFADAGSPVGIATDPRVVAHEFGHGVMWDHLNSPNFAFAHGIGDALSAILFDPDSKAPDRFRTFPFNNVILRRHDRSVASGWGWGGSNDVGSYSSTQIISSLIFRIYRSLGGDALALAEREHASRYTAYLMFHAVPFLSGVVPNTPEGFSGAMQECDQGTVEFEGYAGGWAHKVVRWGFEKQDLYDGKPPKVDIFIEDGRSGEYEFSHQLSKAPGIWNRHRPDDGTDHETPRKCVENYLYVKVGNRGRKQADRVKVSVHRASANRGLVWPDDWSMIGDAVKASKPVPPGGEVIVGPIPWCPEEYCKERILASATTKKDKSNVNTIVGTVPAKRLALADNNVAIRKMEVNRPEDDRPCGGKEKRDKLFRYSVKFVCGCSKGDVVASGRYWTAINVRNTSDEEIRFRKRFSVALPNERPGNVSKVTRNKLGAYEALEIDCEDIAHHTKMPDGCFIKGFAVIESKVELDVVAVYTAAKHDGEVETIDIEDVKARRVRMAPPPPPPPPTKKPDLVPVPAYPSGPPFFPSNYCHSPQELRIIVRNIGPGPAGPTTTRVEFYEDGVVVDVPTEALDPAGGAKDETLLSVQIPPGCLSAQPFEQDEECLFRITVNANPADGVEESDTTNNMDSGNCVILL